MMHIKILIKESIEFEEDPYDKRCGWRRMHKVKRILFF